MIDSLNYINSVSSNARLYLSPNCTNMQFDFHLYSDIDLLNKVFHPNITIRNNLSIPSVNYLVIVRLSNKYKSNYKQEDIKAITKFIRDQDSSFKMLSQIKRKAPKLFSLIEEYLDECEKRNLSNID